MKKYFILIIIASMSIGLYAQDYNDYLREARNYLQSGQVEKAQSSYNMYKKMTGKADYEFESKLKSQENNNDRKVTVRSSASATTTVKVVRHADGSISTYPVDNSNSSNSKSQQKRIRVGDKLLGGRVCYINERAGYGWILLDGVVGVWNACNVSYPLRLPSLEECRIIYANRYIVGINKKTWTSTRKGGNSYYTFDFSNGKEKAMGKDDWWGSCIWIKNFNLNEVSY